MNEYSPCTAIVVGAAGFLGRHVSRAMRDRGCTVYGLGHGKWEQEEYTNWGLSRWLEADISMASLEQVVDKDEPSVVIHCAGSGTVLSSFINPYEDFKRSALTTSGILEFVRRRGEGSIRVVVVSSAAVYGEQGEINVSENAICRPASPYGVSKIIAENLCSSYNRFFGVSVSVVRLFSVYGEGLKKQLLWDAMNKFSHGDMLFLGTGNEMRHWIHVGDAARLLCLAATVSQASFEIYNGAHVKATTREVLRKLAQYAGYDCGPLFNGETHLGNPRRLTANCDHARSQLGWEPQIQLSDGLARYVEWFKREF